LSTVEAAAPSGQRALVLGATGYVGREVVAQLRARGIASTAHVRADSQRLEHWRAHFSALGAEVNCSPWQGEAFEQLMREQAVTHLFLCLGTTLRRSLRKSRSGVPDDYRSVDLGLSSLVIEAAARTGLPMRATLISAARASATSRNKYLRARGELEDRLIASGLAYTIARPAFVTGPTRDEFRVFERVGAALVDMGLLWGAVLGMQILRERYRSIGAPELARALVVYALDPRAAGKLLLGERLRDFP
jgi:uncharacterized protein YbjT (DUF2867 family)